MTASIDFVKHDLTARLGDPRRDFAIVEMNVQVRICPLTGRRARLTPERVKGENLREDIWPDIAAAVEASRGNCPFCPEATTQTTCTFDEAHFGFARLSRGEALIFPNLAPYGPYSAVTIIGHEHYRELGAFDPAKYADAFKLSRDYLGEVVARDGSVRMMAVTQNHLPASGGTLVHPHLQVQADEVGPSFPALLWDKLAAFHTRTGMSFWDELLAHERRTGERYVGRTGGWTWLTMWAPQGMLEVWGVHDDPPTLAALTDEAIDELVGGLLAVQRWYKTRCKNSFNFGLYLHQDDAPGTRLACRILARNSWQPYGRSDRSFYEVILGEQVLDSPPEQWAAQLRPSFA